MTALWDQNSLFMAFEQITRSTMSFGNCLRRSLYICFCIDYRNMGVVCPIMSMLCCSKAVGVNFCSSSKGCKCRVMDVVSVRISASCLNVHLSLTGLAGCAVGQKKVIIWHSLFEVRSRSVATAPVYYFVHLWVRTWQETSPAYC